MSESRGNVFWYQIPVPNGSYKVTLLFADAMGSAPGQRMMDIAANGQMVLARFDILTKVRPGTPHREELAPIQVANGALQMRFRALRGRSIVSGIEILNTNTAPPPPAPAISLAPSNVTLNGGGTQQFTASVTGTSPGVTWSLTSSLAQPGTISATGLYQAPATITGSGDVTVRATSTSSPGLSVTATIRLLSTVRISLSPPATVISGQTHQFTASVTGTSDTRTTWTATGGSISAGMFTAPAVSSTATVTVRARSVADPAQEATVAATVNPAVTPVPPPPPPVSEVTTYVETAGLVAMEAERGALISRNGASWTPVTEPAGFAGSGALASLPNAGVNYQYTYQNSAPEIQLLVQFTNPGVYYIWARGHGDTFADDSIHVGLDDQTVPTGEVLSNFDVTGGGWSWANTAMDSFARRSINILSPGLHKIHIWVREDGVILDRLVLAQDAGFVPTGTGPAESGTTSSGPVLSAAPSSVIFAGILGGANPASQSVNISNLGGQTLSWSATASPSWLSVSPAGGSAPGTLTVSASTSGLAIGPYNGTISISAPGATGSPKSIPVTLNIGAAPPPPPPPAPVLSAAPATLSFATLAGGVNPSAQNIQVTNTGTGSLSWTATESIAWLSLSAASGTAPSSIGVNINATGLGAGSYQGAITVSAAGVSGSPKTVNVTLNVQAVGTTGNQWYVSTTGTPGGNGSISQPWTLATAIAHPAAVRPGDTIWLRGGTYGTGNQITSLLTGSAANPIILRQYPGERATINGGLLVYGSDTWYWGFEVSNLTGASRYNPRPEGVTVFAPRTKLINLVVHDTNQGLSIWRPAIDAEAYGNIVYHNGYDAPDRGHGHGIYSQNETGLKTLHDNIIFNQFGWGIHCYGSDSAFVRNYDTRGNIAFNNGAASLHNNLNDNILFTVGSVMDNIRLEENYTYHTPNRNDGSSRLAWNGGGPHAGLVANGNYWIGGQSAVEVWNWATVEFRNNVAYSLNNTVNTLATQQGQNSRTYNFNNNTYYGANRFAVNTTIGTWDTFRTATGADSASTFTPGRPTGIWKFVRANKYEPGRAHVVIYNWDLASTVAVDLSAALPVGSAYEIRNVQDYFAAPVVSGTYSGGTVSIPMTGLTVAQVLGSGGFLQPPPTGPEFATFVVIKR